jgi:hypothetical protein
MALNRSKTMVAKKFQVDVATEGVQVGRALGRAKTLAGKRAEAGKSGGGSIAFANLLCVSLSDGPAHSELQPVPEAPKSALGRSTTSGGAHSADAQPLCAQARRGRGRGTSRHESKGFAWMTLSRRAVAVNLRARANASARPARWVGS